MVIQANCRTQFTPADLDFVISTLSQNGDHLGAIKRLLTDPEELDAILDEDILFQVLMDSPQVLTVSSHFYFYILVRHVFKQIGVEDRTVADYVAEMLVAFSNQERARNPLGQEERPMDYLFEMLEALNRVDETRQFMIRAHVGNHSLFISGVFPERIRYRAQYRGAPVMEYYERLGSANYRQVQDHRLAKKWDLSSVFSQLSEHFRMVRMALNDMGDRLVFLDTTDAGGIEPGRTPS